MTKYGDFDNEKRKCKEARIMLKSNKGIFAVAKALADRQARCNNKSGFAVDIKFRDEKAYFGNMDHEMGYFLDNWNLIK